MLFILSCTNILNNDSSDYNSIYFKGGGWLEFNGEDINNYLNNNFSLQLWISGNTQDSNDSKAILSVIDEDSGQVLLGLFRNTSVNNGIDIYIDGSFIDTIISNDLDWSLTKFILVTITSEETNDGNNLIKIFINDNEEFNFSNSDIQFGNNNLIIGGKVNSSQTEVSNFWTGYIDEIRLWDLSLSANEISFHFSTPNKLITSIDDPNTEIIEGSYEDPKICNLVGLWRFNYNSPTFSISDESCLEVNLLSENSDNPIDCDCLEVNGTIYTLPGYDVQFSKISL